MRSWPCAPFMRSRAGGGEYVQHCGLRPNIWDKLWCAVRLNSPLKHEPVKPEEVLRSRPEGLRAVLGKDAANVLGACAALLDEVRDLFDAECNKKSSRHVSEGQKKSAQNTRAFWTQIKHVLLRAMPKMPAPLAARSTQWDPLGTRKVREPSDISGCTCAQLDGFPEHMSLDCCGVERFNVCPKTVFQTPFEVVTALFHTGKGSLLGELRVTQVDDSSVMRLVVLDPQEPEKLQIVASGWNMLGHEGRAASDSHGTFMGTNKHRMIWVCPLDEMKEAFKKERKLEHGCAKRRRTGTSLAESSVAL